MILFYCLYVVLYLVWCIVCLLWNSAQIRRVAAQDKRSGICFAYSIKYTPDIISALKRQIRRHSAMSKNYATRWVKITQRVG